MSESYGYGLLVYNSMEIITLKSCRFHNNSANAETKPVGGNALITYILVTLTNDLWHVVIEISQCIFSFGRSDKHSGGLEITDISHHRNHIPATVTLQIISCQFYNNEGMEGADILIGNTNNVIVYQIEIAKSNFSNAISKSTGGSVSIHTYAIISHVTFSDSTFKNDTSTGGLGGAIAIDSAFQANISIIHCTLSNNSALDGGAISVNSGSLNITLCSFKGNTVGRNGGHINYGPYGDGLSLVNCHFENGSSSGGKGGGAYISTGSLHTVNCTFFRNEAAKGGGLAIEINALKMLIITACNFVHNYATRGGGMYIFKLDPYGMTRMLQHVLISIEQSIFTGNAAQSGGGLEASLTSNSNKISTEIRVFYTQFTENIASDKGSALSVLELALQSDKGFQRDSTSGPPLTIVHGLFIKNLVGKFTYKASAISISGIRALHLETTQFLSNIGSAILASSSEITAQGHNLFEDNVALVGGAIHLDCYSYSVLSQEFQEFQKEDVD